MIQLVEVKDDFNFVNGKPGFAIGANQHLAPLPTKVDQVHLELQGPKHQRLESEAAILRLADKGHLFFIKTAEGVVSQLRYKRMLAVEGGPRLALMESLVRQVLAFVQTPDGPWACLGPWAEYLTMWRSEPGGSTVNLFDAPLVDPFAEGVAAAVALTPGAEEPERPVQRVPLGAEVFLIRWRHLRVQEVDEQRKPVSGAQLLIVGPVIIGPHTVTGVYLEEGEVIYAVDAVGRYREADIFLTYEGARSHIERQTQSAGEVEG